MVCRKLLRIMNHKISNEMPDDHDELLNLLKGSPELFTSEERIAMAAKLFGLGRISSGKGGELVGIPRIVFLHRLADFGVPVIDLTAEELEQDVRNAMR